MGGIYGYFFWVGVLVLAPSTLMDETPKHNMKRKRKQLLRFNLLGAVQFMLHAPTPEMDFSSNAIDVKKTCELHHISIQSPWGHVCSHHIVVDVVDGGVDCQIVF